MVVLGLHSCCSYLSSATMRYCLEPSNSAVNTVSAPVRACNNNHGHLGQSFYSQLTLFFTNINLIGLVDIRFV